MLLLLVTNGVTGYLLYWRGAEAFVEGFGAGAAATESNTGVMIVTMLGQIHEGRCGDAAEFLEDRVDAALLVASAHLKAGGSAYDWFVSSRIPRGSIGTLVAYRKSHPHDTDPELAAAVAKVVEEYGEAE